WSTARQIPGGRTELRAETGSAIGPCAVRDVTEETALLQLGVVRHLIQRCCRPDGDAVLASKLEQLGLRPVCHPLQHEDFELFDVLKQPTNRLEDGVLQPLDACHPNEVAPLTAGVV